MTESRQNNSSFSNTKPLKKGSKLSWMKKFVYSGSYKGFGSSKSKVKTANKPVNEPFTTHKRSTDAKDQGFKDGTENSITPRNSSNINSDLHNINYDDSDSNEEEDHFDGENPSTNIPVNLRSKSFSVRSNTSLKDNLSTLPVISLSTVSVRSSTFSEASQPSTSVTVFSDNQTVYTNSSTMGIAPASIMDRNRNQLQGRFYLGNNLSNNTFVTFHSAARSIHTTNANESLYDNHST